MKQYVYFNRYFGNVHEWKVGQVGWGQFNKNIGDGTIFFGGEGGELKNLFLGGSVKKYCCGGSKI